MGYEWGSVLFASPHRLEILRELESPGADTRALTESVGASRVTVQRHCNRFVDLGWVEKRDGRFVRTAVGDHVCRGATAFTDRLSVLERHDRTVRALAGVDGFDPLFLTEAEVSIADEDAPHAPITHYREAMSTTETSSIRAISPIFSELYADVHRDLLAEGVETELLVPERVLETAPPPAEEASPSTFSLRVLDRPVEFALTLTDDAAFVAGLLEGTVVTCVESDDASFREWATDLYAFYRERSVAIPLEADADPE